MVCSLSPPLRCFSTREIAVRRGEKGGRGRALCGGEREGGLKKVRNGRGRGGGELCANFVGDTVYLRRLPDSSFTYRKSFKGFQRGEHTENILL